MSRSNYADGQTGTPAGKNALSVDSVRVAGIVRSGVGVILRGMSACRIVGDSWDMLGVQLGARLANMALSGVSFENLASELV